MDKEFMVESSAEAIPVCLQAVWSRAEGARGESGGTQGRNVLQTVPRTLYTGTSRAARDTVQAYNSLIKQSS